MFTSSYGCVQKYLLDTDWEITYKSRFFIQTHSNYSRRRDLAGKTAEVDELSVTFDLGGSEQNQLAILAGDQMAICAWKKGPPVQLTEFMDGGKVPPGRDKVICWVCCILPQLQTFDSNEDNRFVI